MDVATLGLKLDTSDLKAGITALDQFAAAAKPAADAAHGVETAHAGMSTQAMAAGHSVRSLLESLASGQPITQALAQQMNHLSYAASGPGGITGAFSDAAKSILGLVSPTALAVGGLAAVAAGGVLAYNSILQTEKAFDDTSNAAGVTIGQLHDLAAAASFKGISANDFLKAMDKFSADVYQAQNGMGQLGLVMRANGQSASTFGDYLARAADLIQNATSNQQKLQLLQQMGLPATQDWVRFLSQGSAGIKDAVDQATKFGGAADEQMIAKAREFDAAWAKATTNLENGFKSAFVSILSGVSSFGNAVTSLYLKMGANPLGLLLDGNGSKLTANSDVSGFYKAVGTAAPFNPQKPPAADPNVMLHQIQQQQPLLGLFGEAQPVAKQSEQKPNPTENENDRDSYRKAA